MLPTSSSGNRPTEKPERPDVIILSTPLSPETTLFFKRVFFAGWRNFCGSFNCSIILSFIGVGGFFFGGLMCNIKEKNSRFIYSMTLNSIVVTAATLKLRELIDHLRNKPQSEPLHSLVAGLISCSLCSRVIGSKNQSFGVFLFD